MFDLLCKVDFETGRIKPVRQTSGSGVAYYKIDYDVVLLFGLTEIKAQVAWKENVSSSLYAMCKVLTDLALQGREKRCVLGSCNHVAGQVTDFFVSEGLLECYMMSPERAEIRLFVRGRRLMRV